MFLEAFAPGSAWRSVWLRERGALGLFSRLNLEVAPLRERERGERPKQGPNWPTNLRLGERFSRVSRAKESRNAAVEKEKTMPKILWEMNSLGSPQEGTELIRFSQH